MTESPAAAPEGTGAEERPKVTREIAAEAAVWIARLHGPSRSRQMEQECRAWQATSPAHRDAFERCTDVWQDIPRIGVATAYESVASGRDASARSRGGRREALLRWITTSAVAGAVALGAVFVIHWRGENAYRTNVGEQRLVVLEDGSRMTLNTDTRLRVDFATSQRTVEVSRGEAFFEVAKDARRPFVVRIAGSEVVAVGTAFSVRYARASTTQAVDELVVTLVEGQVNVRAAGRDFGHPLAPAHPVLMKAGDRLLLDEPPRDAVSPVAARVDRPNVERAMAWKRSEAIFDDTGLADAVAEMNRYNRTPIVLLDGLESSGLRVSGLYRTSDSAGFAHAVAALHGLGLHEQAGRLELSKPH
jgi:transmembrane sensor